MWKWEEIQEVLRGPGLLTRWHQVPWWVGPVLSGLLSALAFPPAELHGLAWLCWVPLLVSISTVSGKLAFRSGYLAGLVAWLVNMSWLRSLAQTGCEWPMANLAWCGLSLYAAMYTGLFASLTVRLSAEQGSHRDHGWLAQTFACMRNSALLACLWVALEYVRMTAFTGFPWNPMGVTQFRNLQVIQVASVGGVYAISWLIMYVNATVALALKRVIGLSSWRNKGMGMIGSLVAAACLLIAVNVYGRNQINEFQSRDRVDAVPMAVVDPGVLQVKKWSPEEMSDITESLTRFSEQAATTKPAIVVWPETCLPGVPGYDADVDSLLQNLPARLKAMLIAGSLEVVDGGNPESDLLYNTAFLIDANGVIADRYRKIHLVPFGEYVPMEDSWSFVKKLVPLGFSCVPGTGPVVFQDEAARGLSVLICFEDAIPKLARDAVRKGASTLVFITNDGWFPDTAEPLQHLSQCVFRCVETRCWGVRSANAGATGFISPTGLYDVLDESGRTPGFLTRSIPIVTTQGRQTLYSRWGDRCVAIPCLAISFAAFVLAAARRRWQSLPDTGGA